MCARASPLTGGSWQYDIVGLDDRYQESCAGIERSQKLLLHLIEEVRVPQWLWRRGRMSSQLVPRK